MAKKKTVKEEVKEEPEIEESEMEEEEVVEEPKPVKKKGYTASSSTPFVDIEEETPPPKKEKGNLTTEYNYGYYRCSRDSRRSVV